MAICRHRYVCGQGGRTAKGATGDQRTFRIMQTVQAGIPKVRGNHRAGFLFSAPSSGLLPCLCKALQFLSGTYPTHWMRKIYHSLHSNTHFALPGKRPCCLFADRQICQQLHHGPNVDKITLLLKVKSCLKFSRGCVMMCTSLLSSSKR